MEAPAMERNDHGQLRGRRRGRKRTLTLTHERNAGNNFPDIRFLRHRRHTGDFMQTGIESDRDSVGDSTTDDFIQSNPFAKVELCHGVLESEIESEKQTFGYMFDVHGSSNRILINGFDINVVNVATEKVDYRVYSKRDSYKSAHTFQDWSLVANSSVLTDDGVAKLRWSRAVIIPTATMQSFYIAFNSSSVMYGYPNTSIGYAFAANPHMQLSLGATVDYFGKVQEKEVLWSGAIHYTAESKCTTEKYTVDTTIRIEDISAPSARPRSEPMLFARSRDEIKSGNSRPSEISEITTPISTKGPWKAQATSGAYRRRRPSYGPRANPTITNFPLSSSSGPTLSDVVTEPILLSPSTLVKTLRPPETSGSLPTSPQQLIGVTAVPPAPSGIHINTPNALPLGIMNSTETESLQPASPENLTTKESAPSFKQSPSEISATPTLPVAISSTTWILPLPFYQPRPTENPSIGRTNHFLSLSTLEKRPSIAPSPQPSENNSQIGDSMVPKRSAVPTVFFSSIGDNAILLPLQTRTPNKPPSIILMPIPAKSNNLVIPTRKPTTTQSTIPIGEPKALKVDNLTPQPTNTKSKNPKQLKPSTSMPTELISTGSKQSAIPTDVSSVSKKSVVPTQLEPSTNGPTISSTQSPGTILPPYTPTGLSDTMFPTVLISTLSPAISVNAIITMPNKSSRQPSRISNSPSSAASPLAVTDSSEQPFGASPIPSIRPVNEMPLLISLSTPARMPSIAPNSSFSATNSATPASALNSLSPFELPSKVTLLPTRTIICSLAPEACSQSFPLTSSAPQQVSQVSPTISPGMNPLFCKRLPTECPTQTSSPITSSTPSDSLKPTLTSTPTSNPTLSISPTFTQMPSEALSSLPSMVPTVAVVCTLMPSACEPSYESDVLSLSPSPTMTLTSSSLPSTSPEPSMSAHRSSIPTGTGTPSIISFASEFPSDTRLNSKIPSISPGLSVTAIPTAKPSTEKKSPMTRMPTSPKPHNVDLSGGPSATAQPSLTSSPTQTSTTSDAPSTLAKHSSVPSGEPSVGDFLIIRFPSNVPSFVNSSIDKMPTEVRPPTIQSPTKVSQSCPQLNSTHGLVNREFSFSYSVETTDRAAVFLEDFEPLLLARVAKSLLSCLSPRTAKRRYLENDFLFTILKLEYPNVSELTACTVTNPAARSCWDVRSVVVVTTDEVSREPAQELLLLTLRQLFLHTNFTSRAIPTSVAVTFEGGPTVAPNRNSIEKSTNQSGGGQSLPPSFIIGLSMGGMMLLVLVAIVILGRGKRSKKPYLHVLEEDDNVSGESSAISVPPSSKTDYQTEGGNLICALPLDATVDKRESFPKAAQDRAVMSKEPAEVEKVITNDFESKEESESLILLGIDNPSGHITLTDEGSVHSDISDRSGDYDDSVVENGDFRSLSGSGDDLGSHRYSDSNDLDLGLPEADGFDGEINHASRRYSDIDALRNEYDDESSCTNGLADSVCVIQESEELSEARNDNAQQASWQYSDVNAIRDQYDEGSSFAHSDGDGDFAHQESIAASFEDSSHDYIEQQNSFENSDCDPESEDVSFAGNSGDDQASIGYFDNNTESKGLGNLSHYDLDGRVSDIIAVRLTSEEGIIDAEVDEESEVRYNLRVDSDAGEPIDANTPELSEINKLEMERMDQSDCNESGRLNYSSDTGDRGYHQGYDFHPSKRLISSEDNLTSQDNKNGHSALFVTESSQERNTYFSDDSISISDSDHTIEEEGEGRNDEKLELPTVPFNGSTPAAFGCESNENNLLDISDVMTVEEKDDMPKSGVEPLYKVDTELGPLHDIDNSLRSWTEPIHAVTDNFATGSDFKNGEDEENSPRSRDESLHAATDDFDTESDIKINEVKEELPRSWIEPLQVATSNSRTESEIKPDEAINYSPRVWIERLHADTESGIEIDEKKAKLPTTWIEPLNDDSDSDVKSDGENRSSPRSWVGPDTDADEVPRWTNQHDKERTSEKLESNSDEDETVSSWSDGYRGTTLSRISESTESIGTILSEEVYEYNDILEVKDIQPIDDVMEFSENGGADPFDGDANDSSRDKHHSGNFFDLYDDDGNGDENIDHSEGNPIRHAVRGTFRSDRSDAFNMHDEKIRLPTELENGCSLKSSGVRSEGRYVESDREHSPKKPIDSDDQSNRSLNFQSEDNSVGSDTESGELLPSVSDERSFYSASERSEDQSMDSEGGLLSTLAEETDVRSYDSSSYGQQSPTSPPGSHDDQSVDSKVGLLTRTSLSDTHADDSGCGRFDKRADDGPSMTSPPDTDDDHSAASKVQLLTRIRRSNSRSDGSGSSLVNTLLVESDDDSITDAHNAGFMMRRRQSDTNELNDYSGSLLSDDHSVESDNELLPARRSDILGHSHDEIEHEDERSVEADNELLPPRRSDSDDRSDASEVVSVGDQSDANTNQDAIARMPSVDNDDPSFYSDSYRSDNYESEVDESWRPDERPSDRQASYSSELRYLQSDIEMMAREAELDEESQESDRSEEHSVDSYAQTYLTDESRTYNSPVHSQRSCESSVDYISRPPEPAPPASHGGMLDRYIARTISDPNTEFWQIGDEHTNFSMD